MHKFGNPRSKFRPDSKIKWRKTDVVLHEKNPLVTETSETSPMMWCSCDPLLLELIELF